jgi:hypothetical protein
MTFSVMSERALAISSFNGRELNSKRSEFLMIEPSRWLASNCSSSAPNER